MGFDIGGIFNPAAAAASWARNTFTQGAQATAGLANSALQLRSDAQDLGYSAVNWVGDKGSALKGMVDDHRAFLNSDADRRGGVLGALEKAGSFYIGVNEGMAMGATDMVVGVAKLADGARKITDPTEWMSDPQANLDRITTTGKTVAALSDLSNPGAWVTKTDQNVHTTKALWDGLTKGYREGDVAQGIGRGIFDVGSLAIGVGEGRAVVAGTEAASGVARELSVVGNATQKGKLLSEVDAVSVSSARAVPEWVGAGGSAPRALPAAPERLALTAAPKRLELTAGPHPGGPTLSQVRHTPYRGPAGEQWVARGYDTPVLQQHLRVPLGDTPLGPITGSGGRFVDVASVNGMQRISAREVKNFSRWSTSSTGEKLPKEVALTDDRAQQVIKDAWLRDNWNEARLLQDDPTLRDASGFDPHYEFVGAPPSQEFQDLLAKAGIPWNVYS
jgi:hypothetical protein